MNAPEPPHEPIESHIILLASLASAEGEEATEAALLLVVRGRRLPRALQLRVVNICQEVLQLAEHGEAALQRVLAGRR